MLNISLCIGSILVGLASIQEPRRSTQLFCHVRIPSLVTSVKPKRRFTESGPICTLILDLQPPEIEEIILFKEATQSRAVVAYV